MKYWLLLLLLLGLSDFTASAQVKWPLNQNTEKIEFRGTIPWPTRDTTAWQREQLVHRWYEAKLTDVKLVQLNEWYPNIPPTGYSLPSVAMLRYRRFDYYRVEHTFQLEYKVQLEPTIEGLNYYLSEFQCIWSDEDVIQSSSLEKMPNAPASELAMTRFRKKIVSALTAWY